MNSISNSEEPILYFSYGSNLFTDRIRDSCKSAVFKAVGILKGYRLECCFWSARWKGSVANIIPDSSSNIYGVLWELSPSDLQLLDNQEGVHIGVYERLQLTIEVEGEPFPVQCFGYQLTESTRKEALVKHGEHQQPSKSYKNVIIRGAREHSLPPDYIKALENIEDNGCNEPVILAASMIPPSECT